eukprot:127944-Rhodomonas_salina.2
MSGTERRACVHQMSVFGFFNVKAVYFPWSVPATLPGRSPLLTAFCTRVRAARPLSCPSQAVFCAVSSALRCTCALGT